MIQPSHQITQPSWDAAMSPGNSGNSPALEECEEQVDTLQAMIDNKESELAAKRKNLEEYRQEEHTCKDTFEKEDKKLTWMVREDKILKKAEKAVRFTAVPSPLIMGFGAAMHNPIVAAVGLVLFLGSVAIKLVAKKKIPDIDRKFYPLQQQCQASLNRYETVKNNRERLEGDVQIMAKETSQLKEKREAARAEVEEMARKLATGELPGASEMEIEDDSIIIDGFKLKMNTLDTD
jgi:hypothetical protein